MKLSNIVRGSLWLLFLTTIAWGQKKPAARAVTLTGQVVCSGCWDEADRSTTPYGSKADLECAERCAGKGIPAALAVRQWKGKGFTLYILEDGKFAQDGANRMKYIAQQVKITGPTRSLKGKKYLKVNDLHIVETKAAHAAKEDKPDLALTDMSGVSHKLSDYRGNIVVLNFWAEWCGPCRKEMPLLKDFAMIFGPQDVQFIAASVDDKADLAKVRKFAADYELDFPVWVGATKADMARFGFGSALPSTVILDDKGRVAWRYTSTMSEDELREPILKLIRARK